MRGGGLSLLFALCVTSCAMGPDYQRPAVPLPDSLGAIEAQTDLPSIANLPWWELLQDEELRALIGIALEENNDLQQAVARIEEFEARLLVARVDGVPQVEATANAPVMRHNGFSAPGFASSNNFFLQGSLHWELDVWGRIRRANEAARADLLSREENRRAVVLALVSGVAQAYFDLLRFDVQLDIARRTLQSWEESLKIARARFKQGLTSKLDADQFDAERANAAARVAELERNMVQTQNRLSVLVGRNPMVVPRGRSLTEQVLPPDVPTGLPSELLQRRPDIVQAEYDLAAATARIGVAQAERFPIISLTGILGVASPRLSDFLDAGNDFADAGFGLSRSLLNADIMGFRQAAVEAQARQALAKYEQSILVAFQEVEDALVAVRTAKAQRQAQVEQVDALRSALRLADLRYHGGLTNYLDVLIAKRNLFDAELALMETHRLHLVSIVQLYKALGGGWPPAVTS